MPHHASAPEISLIVNTYMKPRHLELVLASIERQQGVEGCFEVVISDDGSTDETADLVGRRAAEVPFRLAFTSRPHDGFRLSRVRNDGARLARGKRLLFLDGDCMLPSNHVAVHLARCREGVATGGDCGRLDEQQSRSVDPVALSPQTARQLLPASEQRSLVRKLRKWRWYSFIRHATKPRLVGNNICIHRSDFQRINGFDERFVGWGQEDDDITLRLRAAGVRLETVLDRTFSLHVWHPTDPTATARWRDGPNVRYFLRRGRLSCCRQGLVPRSIQDLRWRLPEDLHQSATGRRLAVLLEPAQAALSTAPTIAPEATDQPEIDLVIRPGSGRFLPRSPNKQGTQPECRVLIVEGNATIPRGLAREAEVTFRVPAEHATSQADPSTELAAFLETVG